MSADIKFTAPLLMRGISRSWFELRVSYLCIHHDRWNTIYPGMIVTLAALINSHKPFGQSIYFLGVGLFFIWLQIYSVTLAEQLVSAEEDRLNKPWRPLASGLVTYTSHRTRCILIATCYVFSSILAGVEWCCVTVIVASFLHGQLGFSRLWWAKNILPSIGLLAMVSAQWQIVAPLDRITCRWIIGMFVLMIVVFHLQDLRDVKGDQATGRKTLPIVLGDRWTRITLALTFLIMPLADYVLMDIVRFSWEMYTCLIVTTLLCWVIAVRVLTRHGSTEDQLTWRYWEYWYNLMFISMIICK